MAGRAVINTREQAATLAEASTTNTPAACQQWTRLLFGAPSVGDYDHDGDADAMDGWESEPATAQHTDRNPPRGVPVAYSGGTHGYGHRAISLGGGKIRSTDAGGSGRVATVDLNWPEIHWGLTYLGWSDTIDGQAIPGDATTPEDPMAARIDGVDLSHWQGNVTAAALAAAKAAGVRWAFHKATESTGSADSAYPARVKLIRASGLAFGSYHFARPSASSGAAQARYFLSVASIQPGDMRPMLDLEDDGGLSRAALTAWVGDFVAAVVAATGVPPFIYTHFSLDKTFDCPLWVARYSNAMSQPAIPAPWKTYSVWQFSDGAYGVPKSVAGLGNVDLNTMNGDPAALTKAFQIPGSVPVTPKPVPPPAPTPEETVTPADIKAIADAVAHINIVNKDASGKVEGNGTLAGMISRLDIANNQAADKLDALTAAVTELNATLQAAIQGKS